MLLLFQVGSHGQIGPRVQPHAMADLRVEREVARRKIVKDQVRQIELAITLNVKVSAKCLIFQIILFKSLCLYVSLCIHFALLKSEFTYFAEQNIIVSIDINYFYTPFIFPLYY